MWTFIVAAGHRALRTRVAIPAVAPTHFHTLQNQEKRLDVYKSKTKQTRKQVLACSGCTQ
jgi:hypothetical protein